MREKLPRFLPITRPARAERRQAVEPEEGWKREDGYERLLDVGFIPVFDETTALEQTSIPDFLTEKGFLEWREAQVDLLGEQHARFLVRHPELFPPAEHSHLILFFPGTLLGRNNGLFIPTLFAYKDKTGWRMRMQSLSSRRVKTDNMLRIANVQGEK